MQDISALDPRRLDGVRVLLTDIDDTLSTDGKLTPDAFGALWRLHEAGVKLVMVTGRPAGWCDHIARFWPTDAVVGENGGFYFHHDGDRLERRYLYRDEERAAFRERLNAVRDRILREVPGTGIASDQPYREYDVAVDFCEDVPPLPREQVVRIRDIFTAAGANARISSIHVNGWYGEFDKLSTSRICVREMFGIDIDSDREAVVYCGDSPNDEPMFRHFPLAFGMANVRPFLSLMEAPPAYVTSQRCGAGFCEVADLLLSTRDGPRPSGTGVL